MKLNTVEPSNTETNAYTDSPDLHPNMFIASFQLLFWIFVHPSAWENYLKQISPDLSSDFSLLELNRDQWRHPVIRQILVMEYLICLPAAGILVGFILRLLGIDSSIIVISVAYGIAMAIITDLLYGLVISQAVSYVSNIFNVVVPGLILGLAQSSSTPLQQVTLFAAGVAICSGLYGGISNSLIVHRPAYSFYRQVSSVGAGILVSAIAFGSGHLIVTSFGGNYLPLWGGIPRFANFQFGGPIGGGIATCLWLISVFGLLSRYRIRNQRTGIYMSLTVGVIGGVIVFIADSTSTEIIFSLMAGAQIGLIVGTVFALAYLLAGHLAGPQASALSSALGVGGCGAMINFVIFEQYSWQAIVICFVASVICLTFSAWHSIVFYPLLSLWNFILFRIDEQSPHNTPARLRWHSAFWNEHQRLPLAGLSDHLLLAAERNPEDGRAALNYLATRPQRRAAQIAQIELETRRLEQCTDIQTMGDVHRQLAIGDLTGPANALLNTFSRHSRDVEVARNQTTSYRQRLVLVDIEDRLNRLGRELTLSSEPYAVRFYSIATNWHQVVADRVRQLAQTVERNQEIDNPYIVGVPLTDQQEIFTGRLDIVARIEQLLLDHRHPPLLLYGQRRMGKTSLLRNLRRLLPHTMIPIYVDAQATSLAGDYADFLYLLTMQIIESIKAQKTLVVPPINRDMFVDHPFSSFMEWFGYLEAILEDQQSHLALLIIDEFEAIDSSIQKNRFDGEDVLSLLRHLIQHHPRFKVLLAGSHTLAEFQQWASYLINVQVVHISYLVEDEARQLIENPVKDFALRYQPEALDYILTLTRCHPALIQLLCYEIITLKNQQSPEVRRLAKIQDVDLALKQALQHGNFFFADIKQNQVDSIAAQILNSLASSDTGLSVEMLAHEIDCADTNVVNQSLMFLTHRELIEQADGLFRFQVPLIRHWFLANNG